MQRGRVQVSVPAVLGSGRLSWAEACVPYAGDQVGLFAVPPVGANVWVEFEAGDPDHPILAGCFWGTERSRPRATACRRRRCSKTDGMTITADDLPGGGGLTVEVAPPAVPVRDEDRLHLRRHRAEHRRVQVVLGTASRSRSTTARWR